MCCTGIDVSNRPLGNLFYFTRRLHRQDYPMKSCIFIEVGWLCSRKQQIDQITKKTKSHKLNSAIILYAKSQKSPMGCFNVSGFPLIRLALQSFSRNIGEQSVLNRRLPPYIHLINRYFNRSISLQAWASFSFSHRY
jgi:hypothetical protein